MKWNEVIRSLRQDQGLSQRQLAKISKVSFRQIQRVELKESDVSLRKFEALLRSLRTRLRIDFHEPQWEVLSYFGLPLWDNKYRSTKSSYSHRHFVAELKQAILFFSHRGNSSPYDRHFDAIKGLLLSIKTHYPSLFRTLSEKMCLRVFNLDKIEGRDIKLRNISLGILSQRLHI